MMVFLSIFLVEQFMELSCSAVAPYGGANKEYALDCISQSDGDILVSFRKLRSSILYFSSF